MHPQHEAAARCDHRMQPVDVWTPPFGVHLVQLDRLDPQVTRDLLVVRLGSLGSDMLEAMHGLDVDPTAVSGPGVTDAPALTLQQPLDDLLGQLGAFHQCPPTRGEFLPTRLAAQPLDVLVLAGPRAMGDVACPLRAPTGTAQIGTRECAIVVTLWRERWIRHGIGLPMGIGTDSATFPSDFNCPVVIFLQDYQFFVARVFGAVRQESSGAQGLARNGVGYPQIFSTDLEGLCCKMDLMLKSNTHVTKGIEE